MQAFQNAWNSYSASQEFGIPPRVVEQGRRPLFLKNHFDTSIFPPVSSAEYRQTELLGELSLWEPLTSADRPRAPGPPGSEFTP